MKAAVNRELLQVITSKIQKEGKITFARFMEHALYHPTEGYYTSGEPLKAHQDFYTSPGSHPVFGALIALQLEQMWHHLGMRHPFWVVEQGAGSGLLGRGVMSFLEGYSPEFYQAATYVSVDRTHPSPANDKSDTCHWVQSSTLPFSNLTGCILCNELLDSFPVHRVVTKESKLQEIYVALEGDKLVEVTGEPSTPRLIQRLEEEGVLLQEGQQAEINLDIDPWLKEASSALSTGFLLNVDYGDLAPALYAPHRRLGTLLGYYRHTESYDPFAHLGFQDLTAHVDFTAVINAGRKYHFKEAGFISQRDFLVNLGIRSFIVALSELDMPQPVADANRFAMMELINPEGLGKFKVLALSKGVPEVRLDGLYYDNPTRERLEGKKSLKPLLLGPEHIALLEGKYPHLAWDWQKMWDNR